MFGIKPLIPDAYSVFYYMALCDNKECHVYQQLKPALCHLWISVILRAKGEEEGMLV